MGMPGSQAQTEALVKQRQNQRVLMAITVGMEFLEDRQVSGPIHYSEGLTDLKWLLRLLLAGQAAINFTPPGLAAAPAGSSDSGKRIGATTFDE